MVASHRGGTQSAALLCGFPQHLIVTPNHSDEAVLCPSPGDIVLSCAQAAPQGDICRNKLATNS